MNARYSTINVLSAVCIALVLSNSPGSLLAVDVPAGQPNIVVFLVDDK